jgi:gluconokinase
MSGPILIMGVAGSGKTTIGRLLAQRLAKDFIDADDLHPPANRRKMAAGTALTDEDRGPWLRLVGAALAHAAPVVACSALRRAHRDVLRQAAPQLRLVFLHGSPEVLAARLAARVHPFMPATLLDSQLATLEPPTQAEGALSIDISAPPCEILARLIVALG